VFERCSVFRFLSKEDKEFCAFCSFVNFVVNLRIDKKAIKGECE
jgi:hypothetical protein